MFKIWFENWLSQFWNEKHKIMTVSMSIWQYQPATLKTINRAVCSFRWTFCVNNFKKMNVQSVYDFDISLLYLQSKCFCMIHVAIIRAAGFFTYLMGLVDGVLSLFSYRIFIQYRSFYRHYLTLQFHYVSEQRWRIWRIRHFFSVLIEKFNIYFFKTKTTN